MRPFTQDWFSTISFGDAVKVGVFAVGFIVGYVKLTERVDHEAELRRMLEGKTLELVAQVRMAQQENASRFDQRFSENASRDRETITEIKTGLNRLNDKVDAIASIQRNNLPRDATR